MVERIRFPKGRVLRLRALLVVIPWRMKFCHFVVAVVVLLVALAWVCQRLPSAGFAAASMPSPDELAARAALDLAAAHGALDFREVSRLPMPHGALVILADVKPAAGGPPERWTFRFDSRRALVHAAAGPRVVLSRPE